MFWSPDQKRDQTDPAWRTRLFIFRTCLGGWALPSPLITSTKINPDPGRPFHPGPALQATFFNHIS